MARNNQIYFAICVDAKKCPKFTEGNFYPIFGKNNGLQIFDNKGHECLLHNYGDRLICAEHDEREGAEFIGFIEEYYDDFCFYNLNWEENNESLP